MGLFDFLFGKPKRRRRRSTRTQSSGTVGGSPSQQVNAPGINQLQPSSSPIIRDNSGAGYPGTNAVATFVNQTGLDPTDRSSPWVNYYHQQYNSWPDDDLLSGNTDPTSLGQYAQSAIGYLQSVGAM